ncbi:sugar diacid recognition domain-containing protein [Lentibacillus sp. N15]|uniref:CdaR family transcriptional regulator n=1 Tax=Lentibacillus songyuanensis TaxID=3136161 RepID=UPI0031BB06E2
MNISTKLAQAIVFDMKEIIKQDINYINTDGIIIASTNKNRIGSFHGGGKKVSETSDNLIIRYDGEYQGSRKGINLPIYFDSKIVGAIGITGESHEVEKYAAIIKRMTELLIKDAYMTDLKNKEKENQRIIIEELLFSGKQNTRSILNQLKVFNILENLSRVIVISEICGESYNLICSNSKIKNIFDYKLVKYPKNFMMQNKNRIIMVLEDSKDLAYILKDIAKIVHENYGLKLKFGVGTIENDLSKMRDSYEKALVALNWSLFNKSEYIKFYNDIDVEMIVENISKNVQEEFSNKIIGNLDDNDIAEYEQIIILFEKYNGSIKQISSEMFIHKNTLQYKLNKLHNITGYDLRRYRDFMVLKLAYLFVKNERNRRTVDGEAQLV